MWRETPVDEYSFEPQGYTLSSGGILIPEFPPAPPIGIDLFAGCGGFSLGMEMGGIDVAVAVDSWPTAALPPAAAATLSFEIA